MTISILDPPDNFETTLGTLPNDVDIRHSPTDSEIFIVFAHWRSEMEQRFRTAMTHISSDGAIWVAWPKKSSGVETDMTEDTMRELFLPTGLVDNKVCAIDETWSGLRFVVRKENRPGWDLRPCATN